MLLKWTYKQSARTRVLLSIFTVFITPSLHLFAKFNIYLLNVANQVMNNELPALPACIFESNEMGTIN